jgi:hypothetical protein
MGKDAKGGGGKGKGKQAASGSDENASKGKGKAGKAADGLGTCTYVKGRIFSPFTSTLGPVYFPMFPVFIFTSTNNIRAYRSNIILTILFTILKSKLKF